MAWPTSTHFQTTFSGPDAAYLFQTYWSMLLLTVDSASSLVSASHTRHVVFFASALITKPSPPSTPTSLSNLIRLPSAERVCVVCKFSCQSSVSCHALPTPSPLAPPFLFQLFYWLLFPISMHVGVNQDFLFSAWASDRRVPWCEFRHIRLWEIFRRKKRNEQDEVKKEETLEEIKMESAQNAQSKWKEREG